MSHDSLPCGFTLNYRGEKGEKPQNGKVATAKARYWLLHYYDCLPTHPSHRILSGYPRHLIRATRYSLASYPWDLRGYRIEAVAASRLLRRSTTTSGSSPWRIEEGAAREEVVRACVYHLTPLLRGDRPPLLSLSFLGSPYHQFASLLSASSPPTMEERFEYLQMLRRRP